MSRRAPRRDRGYTIVESVVTVVLLGIVVIPVISSVRTSIKASSLSHTAAAVEVVLLNVADRVNRAPIACGYDEFASAAAVAQGWPGDRATVEVAWRDGDIWVAEGASGDGCEYPGPTIDLVQRVSIVVTSPNGEISRRLEVVKSVV